jgi:hypothetical protein
MLQFTDRAPITGTKRTADGFLTAVAKSVRTGVQQYLGAELGRPDLGMVGIYRPDAAVFDQASLQSFSHAPVTLDHPSVAVTADNWKELAVGEVSTAARKDGIWLELPLVLKDSAAIAAVESGKRELSAGYTSELTWADGVAPDGTPYQAVMSAIRINHLAIVDKARAGSEARIGDSGAATNWGVSPIPQPEQESRTMSDRTVLVDGLSVVTNDAGAQAIAKLMADAATRQTAHDAALAAKDALVAAADAKLAKAEAERDAALANVLDAAALDARVAARGDLVARVKVLAPSVVADGKSDLDVKRAVLADRKINLDGKSDAYVEARFDTLVEDAQGADTTAQTLASREQQVSDADAEAAALAAANNHNAWRAA